MALGPKNELSEQDYLIEIIEDIQNEDVGTKSIRKDKFLAFDQNFSPQLTFSEVRIVR